MSRPINISTLFYTDEDKFGYKIHQIGKNLLHCVQLPRNVFTFLKNEELSKKSGIYFLLNKSENKIYIGQADNILNRLNYHIKDEDKDWFDEIIFFALEDKQMSLTYVNYLECHYISAFKNSKAWTIKNEQFPPMPPLGRFERPDADEFIKLIDLYLMALNISIQNKSFESIITNERVFKFKKCNGVYKNGKFIILAGSILIDEYSQKIEGLSKQNKQYKSQKERLELFRDEIYNLISETKAKRNGNEIELVYDLPVSSPSKAACFAQCGHALNGWEKWKNSKGETLDDIYRKNISPTELS